MSWKSRVKASWALISIFAQTLVDLIIILKYEPPHDKTNEMAVRRAKTQISLGIRPVWSESSLSAWIKLGVLATHWAHSKDSDQTGWMPRLIWVFAACTDFVGFVMSWLII